MDSKVITLYSNSTLERWVGTSLGTVECITRLHIGLIMDLLLQTEKIFQTEEQQSHALLLRVDRPSELVERRFLHF